MAGFGGPLTFRMPAARMVKKLIQLRGNRFSLLHSILPCRIACIPLLTIHSRYNQRYVLFAPWPYDIEHRTIFLTVKLPFVANIDTRPRVNQANRYNPTTPFAPLNQPPSGNR